MGFTAGRQQALHLWVRLLAVDRMDGVLGDSGVQWYILLGVLGPEKWRGLWDPGPRAGSYHFPPCLQPSKEPSLLTRSALDAYFIRMPAAEL